MRAALAATLLLSVECFIACCVHDRFVRPFVGDVLVVPLLYSAARIVVRRRPLAIAFGVLLFSYVVEALQAIDYVALLHLEHHRVLSIIMGRTFQWSDLLAYTVGFGIVLASRFFARDARPASMASRPSSSSASTSWSGRRRAISRTRGKVASSSASYAGRASSVAPPVDLE